jgi:hypothetical protein
MPKKKPSPYELGKVKGQVDYNEKHSVRIYYFNHIMYWIWRTLALVLGSTAAIKLLIEIMR